MIIKHKSKIIKFITRQKINGKPIVAGFATGNIIYFEDTLTRKIDLIPLHKGQIKEEFKRLKHAIDKVTIDLDMLQSKVAREIDKKHAKIFDFHKVILHDIDLLQEIELSLNSDLVNVEYIVQNVFHRKENQIRNIKSNIIKEKAVDIADVSRRLINALIGNNKVQINIPKNSIIYAKRLLPSDTAVINVQNVAGIITHEGSENSHCAILARALDIPFVSQIHMKPIFIPNSSKAIIDGEQGILIINPNKKDITSYPDLIKKRFEKKRNIIAKIKNVKFILDGEPIKVSANVSSRSDIIMAEKLGADSIGLYRTEPFYMGMDQLPNEDDLFRELTDSLTIIKDKKITLRLLDLGGDKTLPFIKLVDLKDPSLGLNGIRLLLKFPELLKMQLRVFLRLSANFKIRILVPMVTLINDISEVKRYLMQEKEKLKNENIPFNNSINIGVMIETPAALLTIDKLLDLSDFISIGTNDLIQYVMAASREKRNVSAYYKAGFKLLLPSLSQIISKAHAKKKECGICGESAGNLSFIKSLLKIKLKNFSVQPSKIPDVKNKIYSTLKQLN